MAPGKCQTDFQPVRSTSDLAARLGLSRWTVSRALNGHPSIRKETTARVLAAAREFGFSPNLLGRGLRSGRTDLVGICLPDLVDYHLTGKIAGLHDALTSRGLSPVLQITTGGEAGEVVALERFAAMRCTAVITIASGLSTGNPAVAALEGSGIKLVWIDPLGKVGGRVVATDRARAMREAAGHLIELGHTRIAALGLDGRRAYGSQRVAGVRAGCRTHGLIFEDTVTFLSSPDAVDDFSAGWMIGGKFLALSPRPTAVLALNDRIATGFIGSVKEAGFQVPGDVSVVGYDNSRFARYGNPALTTIDPGIDELIRKTLALLESGRSVRKATVRPELVLRNSSAPLPKDPRKRVANQSLVRRRVREPSRVENGTVDE